MWLLGGLLLSFPTFPLKKGTRALCPFVSLNSATICACTHKREKRQRGARTELNKLFSPHVQTTRALWRLRRQLTLLPGLLSEHNWPCCHHQVTTNLPRCHQVVVDLPHHHARAQRYWMLWTVSRTCEKENTKSAIMLASNWLKHVEVAMLCTICHKFNLVNSRNKPVCGLVNHASSLGRTKLFSIYDPKCMPLL